MSVTISGDDCRIGISLSQPSATYRRIANPLVIKCNIEISILGLSISQAVDFEYASIISFYNDLFSAHAQLVGKAELVALDATFDLSVVFSVREVLLQVTCLRRELPSMNLVLKAKSDQSYFVESLSELKSLLKDLDEQMR